MQQPIDFNKMITDGFAVIPKVLSTTTVAEILKSVAVVSLENQVRSRHDCLYAIRHLFREIPTLKFLVQHKALRNLVEPILGKSAQVVRAIFFDKRPQVNWKVPWHQDVTIAVSEKKMITGFAPWSIKEGVFYVQPPTTILENMLTLRLHLDDCPMEHGALSVLPGSHCQGRLTREQIEILRQTQVSVGCPVKQGDVLMMRPLLLHASSAATTVTPNWHRRVIHLEYVAISLPGGLEWYERFPMT